jgi:hypothetical protein
MGSCPKRRAFLHRICLRTLSMSPSLAPSTQMRLMPMWAPDQIQAMAEVGKSGLDPTETVENRQLVTAARRAPPVGAAAAIAEVAAAATAAAVPAVAIAVVDPAAEEGAVEATVAEVVAATAVEAAAATGRANAVNSHYASGTCQKNKNPAGRSELTAGPTSRRTKFTADAVAVPVANPSLPGPPWLPLSKFRNPASGSASSKA